MAAALRDEFNVRQKREGAALDDPLCGLQHKECRWAGGQGRATCCRASRRRAACKIPFLASLHQSDTTLVQRPFPRSDHSQTPSTRQKQASSTR